MVARCTRLVRIAGGNRFDTAAKLYTFARGTLTAGNGSHYGSGAGDPVFLANGLPGFPDALAVGPLAAKAGAVLLTTSATRLEPTARAFLAANKASLGTVTALGKSPTPPSPPPKPPSSRLPARGSRLRGPRNGLDHDSAINLDLITTVPRSTLIRPLGMLLDAQERDLSRAFQAAFDLDD